MRKIYTGIAAAGPGSAWLTLAKRPCIGFLYPNASPHVSEPQLYVERHIDLHEVSRVAPTGGSPIRYDIPRSDCRYQMMLDQGHATESLNHQASSS